VGQRHRAFDRIARGIQSPAGEIRRVQKHYRLELSKNPALAAFRKEVKRPKVTLLFGARDLKINHAVVLAEYLKQSVKTKAAPVKKKPQAATRRRSR
jgi:hypothetical protein